MYNKVKDKKTEKQENNESRIIYIISFIFVILLLTAIYTYLAISIEKKKKEVSPGIIEIPPEVTYTCEIVDGIYWGKDSKEVDAKTFDEECVQVTPVNPKPYNPKPTPKTYTCEIVNSEYWGKDSNKVDYETYYDDCVKHTIKYTCKVVDGEYWGKNSTKVDQVTYEDECIEKTYTCKIVEGVYWGKDSIKVTQSQYESECVQTYTCEIVNGEYWGKDNVKVDAETYNLECVQTYTCKIVDGVYWGKNSTIVDSSTYDLECGDPTPIVVPNWKIIFENIVEKTGSVEPVSAPSIDTLKTSITYSVMLTKPNEYYSFDVDISNKGNMDAKIYDTVNTELTDMQKRYLEYTVKYKDGNEISENDLLLQGETKTITVLLKFKDVSSASDLPPVDELLTLTYKIIYVEK